MGKDASPRYQQSAGNCARIPIPKAVCAPKNATAFPGETLPLAIGLSTDLITLLSRFLSHKSLIVHPAPLIITAPTPNNPNIHKVLPRGACVSIAAIVIAHVHGMYNNHVPTGFSSLISSAYGIHLAGNLDTYGPKPFNLASRASCNSFSVKTAGALPPELPLLTLWKRAN